MKSYENNNNFSDDATQKVWDAAKSIRIAMMTTWDGNKQCARPMTSHVFKERHAIYFLDRQGSDKEKQIEEYPTVGLQFMNNVSNTYIAITGKANISNDRELIKECWSDFYKAWWDSENDPDIRVIIFNPEVAEIWDGNNIMVASAKMLLSAVTGAKPSFGDNKKVTL